MDLKVSENTKTSYAFNLPAMTSCPGATDKCKAVCYANSGRYLMNGKWTTDHNWSVIQKDPTAVERIRWPRSKDVQDFRLMSAGDIFSLEFGRSVFKMCDLNPHLGFWAYSRSFAILRELLTERSVPENLTLFVSADEDNLRQAREMSRKFGLPIAYMGDVAPNAEAFECPAIANPDKFPLSKRKAEAPCQRCRYCFDRKKKFVVFRLLKGVRFRIHT